MRTAPASVTRNQRGVAMVVALLVLLTISVFAGLLLVSVNTETKIAGHSVRTSEALNIAEAGVVEAIARLNVGDIPDTNNPRFVAQIFNTAPGSVPVLGADSVGLATAQPTGRWLDYSTANRGPDVLTVKYRTDPAQTVIYRYDDGTVPSVQTASGFNIWEIRSTGTVGRDRRTIVTEVTREPFNLNVKAALAAQVGIDFLGNSVVCGFNHRGDTPIGIKGRPPCNLYETGNGNLPGGWSEGQITSSGSSQQFGSPVNTIDSQTGFYAGPWEALGMTQAEFFTWIGPATAVEPDPPKGLMYLDNNSVSQDQSGDFAFPGGNGEGLLYVDGDLSINADLTFKGLIYVEGNTKINGTLRVLGAIIVRGKTTIKHANGDAGLLYSEDAIQFALARYGGDFVTLSWREQ